MKFIDDELAIDGCLFSSLPEVIKKKIYSNDIGAIEILCTWCDDNVEKFTTTYKKFTCDLT